MESNSKVVELKIPQLDQGGEIELCKWNIGPGAVFEAGDEICDLITDKAVFSLEAPVRGTLVEQIFKEGSLVNPGQVVGLAEIMPT